MNRIYRFLALDKISTIVRSSPFPYHLCDLAFGLLPPPSRGAANICRRHLSVPFLHPLFLNPPRPLCRQYYVAEKQRPDGPINSYDDKHSTFPFLPPAPPALIEIVLRLFPFSFPLHSGERARGGEKGGAKSDASGQMENDISPRKEEVKAALHKGHIDPH